MKWFEERSQPQGIFGSNICKSTGNFQSVASYFSSARLRHISPQPLYIASLIYIVPWLVPSQWIMALWKCPREMPSRDYPRYKVHLFLLLSRYSLPSILRFSYKAVERPEVIGRSVGVTFYEHKHTVGPTFRVIFITIGILLFKSDFSFASLPNMAVLRRYITGAWGTRIYQLLR